MNFVELWVVLMVFAVCKFYLRWIFTLGFRSSTTTIGNLCFRHVLPPPIGVWPVVLALNGYRRLYMVCVRPILRRIKRRRINGESEVVIWVWNLNEVELYLSLFFLWSVTRGFWLMMVVEESSVTYVGIFIGGVELSIDHWDDRKLGKMKGRGGLVEIFKKILKMINQIKKIKNY